ncbi:DNA polymerase [Rhynchospora pubera]|uniref:DNA polymerase n=1 Tax=Rhynchospora pubera TaxID=906938 RepID=A0AAV8CGD9_9POAL|nr:DNA polymerase [Rhynchospora pubera]
MASPSESGRVLSVRIVSHDYYMAPPIPDLDFSISSFHGRKIEEVPVIRIYGSTPAGQKACLHVHKALPYLYIPCPDEILHNPEPEKGNSYINSFLTALEKAFKTRGTSKKQHVHGCTIVKAKRMYGFFPTEELFMKIYLYYPHDISRASILLLSGAIMSRQFQPYESHIPYLLQFLVDYNLYGMSHIHVANMKFRPPIPDSFNKCSSRLKEKSVSASDNSQADPSDCSMGNSTIWIASTISDDLLWDSSITENFARRQSISMLEADSCVDDILNEKLKMYTSLSQTTTDVKMVQSLIPIWEEFMRSGLQEANVPDAGKPQPETVLASFMNNSEYHKIISKLNLEKDTSLINLSPTEEAERIEQCIQSLIGICGSAALGKMVDLSGMDLKDNELFVTSAMGPEGEEMRIGGPSTSQEPINKEALGLLRWLASSQAANDVTSDDELTSEAILTPLFPQKTYQAALETAHIDFETASQRECQDILDSADVQNTSLKDPDNASTSSGDFVIPQIDGSPDEKEHITPYKDMKKNVKRSREKKSPWGILPLSAKKREVGSSITSPSVDFNLNFTDSEANSSSSEGAEINGLVPPSSVRDLMRMQRSSRPDVRESANSSAMLDFELSCQELNSNIIKREDSSEMAFIERPPKRDQLEDFNYCLESSTNAAGPGLNNLVPFFDLEPERKEENKCSGVEKHHEAQQIALGVPTHFQNDGSILYLLTQAFSPPSSDSVSQWLVQEGKQNTINEAVDTNALHKRTIINSKSDMPQSNKETKITSAVKGNGINDTDSCNEYSQISGPDDKGKLTPLSQIGFQDPASVGRGQQLTIISVEVLAECRGDLRPDPKFDAINIVTLCVQDDSFLTVDTYVLMRGTSEEYCRRNVDGVSGCNFVIFPEERYVFEYFIDLMSSLDPDILIGWEVQRGSVGFLAERAAYLGISLLKRISRTPIQDKKPKFTNNSDKEASTSTEDVVDDEWGRTHASGVHVGGRIVLNLWRLMRGEVKINMYSMEAVVEEVLRRKVPLISARVLNRWFASGPRVARHRSIEYICDRACLNLELINQLDMISRTSELARVFGIDFFSVLSRGSQFRVESMLLRLAHTQNYLAISPGSQQVALQPAMECLPLVMEPESGFYPDPVVVLDFQSLYPSMIIAYNLCYSTCLGKIFPSRSTVLGVSSYQLDLRHLSDLEDGLLLAPNGVLYVQSKVRKGILPRLLQEILSTRIMVKQAMKKLSSSQQVLQRIYNARQLALKLIANVTYGYTAAGFSGRMPCAELADSIVQCGRRTLETAILFVNQNPRWKARVVYGDTDSMFVLLKGRTVEEAFMIGKEIACAVTTMNPEPVTLKLEKVYQPCFLLTKKRYVGYSYESPDQKEPIFDAKGIETVRRDTCPAVAKILETSIRIMFEHQDIKKVKSYLERQWTRILSGKISLQDFIFAKEVRLGTYSTRVGTLPPSAIVAMKIMAQDPRAEPQYGERVPYVVVHGEPGARLVDMVIDPYLLLDLDSPYRLNDLYYINKQIIPVLQRIFGLVGADLYRWFAEMSRPIRRTLKYNLKENNRGGRIDRYYASKHCMVCGMFTRRLDCLCDDCVEMEDVVDTVLVVRVAKLEREAQHLNDICRHCGGADWIVESGVKCVSLACPVFYERTKIQKELRSLSKFAADAGHFPHCLAELF